MADCIRIVYYERFEWTINSISTFISSGPDGILPELLQEWQEILPRQVHVLFIFDVRILSYTMEEVRPLLIPKQGKSNYFQVKSSIPLVWHYLCKNTGKVSISSYFRENSLNKYPIHTHQYIYLKIWTSGEVTRFKHEFFPPHNCGFKSMPFSSIHTHAF